MNINNTNMHDATHNRSGCKSQLKTMILFVLSKILEQMLFKYF